MELEWYIFQQLATLQGSEAQLNVLWRPDSTQIATIEGGVFPETWQGRVQIWDVASQQKEHSIDVTFYFERNFPISNRLNWNPSGLPLLAVVGGILEEINGSVVVDTVATIFLINTDVGYIDKEIPLVTNYVGSAVVWYPSGGKVIVSDPAGFGVYDIATNQYEGATSFHDYVKVLAWSPNGRYLAANDNIYDYTTGAYLGFFTRISEIQAIDWHPDGSKLATVSGFGNIKIEDATLLSGFQVNPIANAGIDQTLTNGDDSESVTLDGSASSDPDGTIVSYIWTENGQQIATGVTSQVTLTTGVHVITLTVTDNDGLTHSDEVVITITMPGTGLRGEYFDNADFTGFKFARINPQVNYDWGTGSPKGI